MEKKLRYYGCIEAKKILNKKGFEINNNKKKLTADPERISTFMKLNIYNADRISNWREKFVIQ